MAVTKIWAIKDSLQRVLDYAANPNKTEYDALAQTLHYAENDTKTKLNESAQLVTGIHCRADHVWEDMRAVQERFGKTDGVVALHAYQSFREGEVTPEQCHEIGVALARKVWGKRFQVLVATHMNTNNLHNHFVINSVSYVDGKKYEQRRSQYAEFRAASDKLCREYGLSVVEQPKAKEPARYARMREAIDQACEDTPAPCRCRPYAPAESHRVGTAAETAWDRRAKSPRHRPPCNTWRHFRCSQTRSRSTER